MILYIYVCVCVRERERENTKNGMEDFHTLIRLSVILFTTSHLILH